MKIHISSFEKDLISSYLIVLQNYKGVKITHKINLLIHKSESPTATHKTSESGSCNAKSLSRELMPGILSKEVMSDCFFPETSWCSGVFRSKGVQVFLCFGLMESLCWFWWEAVLLTIDTCVWGDSCVYRYSARIVRSWLAASVAVSRSIAGVMEVDVLNDKFNCNCSWIEWHKAMVYPVNPGECWGQW